jgi:hypothetical protein
MKPLTLALFIAIAVLFAGCDAVVTSNHITTATESLIQDDLTGTWQNGDGVLEVAFDSTGTGHLAGLEWKTDRFEVSQTSFQAIKLKDTLILTIKSPDEEDEGYLLAAMRIDENGDATFFGPTTDTWAGMVETAQIKGEIERGRHSTTVLVPDANSIVSSMPLEKLFNFEESMALKRILPLEGDE